MAYGMLGHVGISFQQSYGTQFTSSLDYIPAISESFTQEIEALSAEGMRGRLDEGDHYEGMHSISGEITTEIHPIYIGKFLKGFCNHSSGTLVGSVYTHLMRPAQSDFDFASAVPPATIEVHRDVGSAFLYYDCNLNSISIEIANGTIDRMTAGWVGGNFAWGAKTAASYDAGSYFPWDVSSIGVAGAGIDKFSTLTLTFNNQLEAKHTLNGTKFASRVKRTGFRTIEVGGTMLFEDTVQASHFTGQTLQRLVVTATGESLTTSQSALFSVDIPQMVYTAFPTNMGGPGMIEVGITGKGKFDTTSSYSVQFTVINTKASY